MASLPELVAAVGSVESIAATGQALEQQWGPTLARTRVVENGVNGECEIAIAPPPSGAAGDVAAGLADSTLPFGIPPHVGASRSADMATDLELDFLLNLDALPATHIHPVRACCVDR
jgi:hypothetical protein